jgi:hypothetical protein
LARQVLGLESTEDYTLARKLCTMQRKPSEKVEIDDYSAKPWKVTSAETSKLLLAIKKANPPKFFPTDWNIAPPELKPSQTDSL